MRTALATVAVALVVVAGLDLLLAVVFRHRIAVRLGQASSAPVRPKVRLARAAFLPQLVAGRLRGLEFWIRDCTVGGVLCTEIRGSARQIDAAWRARRTAGAGGALAGELTAVATIGYPVLESRLPPGVQVHPDGVDLKLTGTLLRVPLAGKLAVTAAPDRITLVPKVAGVPAMVGFVIALPGLREGVRISGTQVTARGLEVEVTGNGVRLGPRPGQIAATLAEPNLES